MFDAAQIRVDSPRTFGWQLCQFQTEMNGLVMQPKQAGRINYF